MFDSCDRWLAWHKLSKIWCTLFSLTKLSVLRTIEKHCTATIWLLRPKIWTHCQTITARCDFPECDYYWTEFIPTKISYWIVNEKNWYVLSIFSCYLKIFNIRPLPDLIRRTTLKVFFCVRVTVFPFLFNGTDILI